MDIRKKRGCAVLVVFLFSFLLFPLASAALGISPAKQRVNFQPGQELEYSFRVYAGSDKTLEIYSAGEFTELVRLDKRTINGGGEFGVKIRLPAVMATPGTHTILIGVREKSDEEEGVGTSVAVQAPIFIIVPYPGKYAEISFSTGNVNAGENISFRIEVSSKGEEDINANARVDIYKGKDRVNAVYLGSKNIASQQMALFKGELSTENLKPGDYNASAVVGYEIGETEQSVKLRVGQLYINVTNFTEEVLKKGIRPLEVNVESFWNDEINNVYAQVFLFNKDNQIVSEFSTPGVTLASWERKTLAGYLDTERLDVGNYRIRIDVNYADAKTSVEGNFRIVKERNYFIMAIIVVIAILILMMIILAILYMRMVFRRGNLVLQGKSPKNKKSKIKTMRN